jgi:hypothetical protein
MWIIRITSRGRLTRSGHAQNDVAPFTIDTMISVPSLAISGFGTMFFDDPGIAFANMGGRCARAGGW